MECTWPTTTTTKRIIGHRKQTESSKRRPERSDGVWPSETKGTGIISGGKSQWQRFMAHFITPVNVLLLTY